MISWGILTVLMAFIQAVREFYIVRFLVGAAEAGFFPAVVVNWSGSLSLISEVFLKSPNVRWVHSRSAGLERTLFPELIASDVVMTNGSGVFSPSLGEFALATILYFAKDFRRMIRNQMAGKWEPFDILPISGQTVGIVGYGDIGRAVASRVRAMGMHVLAVKRHVPAQNPADPFADQIYPTDRRKEMLARCDYVVVAAPLNTETVGLIGSAEFAAMKPTSVIINVGRGPVIDERAMIDALSQHSGEPHRLDERHPRCSAGYAQAALGAHYLDLLGGGPRRLRVLCRVCRVEVRP